MNQDGVHWQTSCCYNDATLHSITCVLSTSTFISKFRV